MSWQIFCGFKNLDKLRVRMRKFKNTLLVGFFKNRCQNRLFIEDFLYKIESEDFLKGFLF